MLIPAVGEAGDDERDLGQPAELKVVEVIALAAQRALVSKGDYQKTNTLSVLPKGTLSQPML